MVKYSKINSTKSPASGARGYTNLFLQSEQRRCQYSSAHLVVPIMRLSQEDRWRLWNSSCRMSCKMTGTLCMQAYYNLSDLRFTLGMIALQYHTQPTAATWQMSPLTNFIIIANLFHFINIQHKFSKWRMSNTTILTREVRLIYHMRYWIRFYAQGIVDIKVWSWLYLDIYCI